jgi:hypothetical protein
MPPPRHPPPPLAPPPPLPPLALPSTSVVGSPPSLPPASSPSLQCPSSLHLCGRRMASAPTSPMPDLPHAGPPLTLAAGNWVTLSLHRRTAGHRRLHLQAPWSLQSSSDLVPPPPDPPSPPPALLGPGCSLHRFPSRSLLSALPDRSCGGPPAVALDVVASPDTPLVAAGSVLGHGLFMPLKAVAVLRLHHSVSLVHPARSLILSMPHLRQANPPSL